MKINQLYTSFLLLLSMFLFSCENESVKPNQEEIAFNIDKQSIYLGDTIFIFGLEEMNNSNLNIVLRNSENIDSLIPVTNSNLSMINFNLKGNYKIFIENGIDTSESFDLEFYDYPNFQTVVVAPGSYTRGYVWGLPDENNEQEIQISHSLEVMIYEMSEAEYNYIMRDSNFNYNGSKPIAGIDWDDVLEYCMILNNRMNLEIPFTFTQSENLDISKNGWRFPTEAEWEYLCKAGGNEQVPSSENLSEVAWFIENSGSNMFDRGLKRANAFGLYDMLGNVSEWCWDLYEEDYYDYGPNINPEGPIRYDDNRPSTWIPTYVKRGGSINTPTSRCRSSFRMSTENDPQTIGVRLVRTIQ